MAIRLVCEKCDREVSFDNRDAGQRVRCPKCKAPIDLPEEEEERDEPRNKGRSRRDAEKESPRASRSSRDRDEEDDRPRKRSRDEDEPPEKKPKKKKQSGSGMVLWLALGGGGVLILGLVIGLVLVFALGGGVTVFGGFAEARYLPDGCQSITSERIGQLRTTKFYEASEAKRNAKGARSSDHGLKNEDVDRITTGSLGADKVTILTTTRSVTPDDFKEALKKTFGGGLPGLASNYKEEKVGGYTLHVGGLGNRAFCMPEGRIIVVGAADVLRQLLQRGGKPQFSPALQRAYSDASFNSSRVMILTTSIPSGFNVPNAESFPEATLMQIDFGSTVSTKSKAYFKDAETAEQFRRKSEENRDKDSILGGEAAKEAKQNGRISRSGSVVTMTTHVREQTMIDDLNRR